jgi:hypothetical protein
MGRRPPHLHAQSVLSTALIAKLIFKVIGSLNLNDEGRVYKIKMIHKLIKDIKGYHIPFWSSSISPIEESYDGYSVPLVIVAGEPPNSVILSTGYMYTRG